MKRGNRFTEIPDELKREISSAILTWARYLEKLRKLKLDEDIKLDQDYINSEILLLDSDIKKKIADLAYLINHEEKHKLSGFHLIESRSGLGYRLNIHPALIFIFKTSQLR